MKFKFIKTYQPEYSKELMLRWEVLRKPFGIPPGIEPSMQEENSLHLVALEKGEVVGCIVCHQDNTSCGTLFDMAVSSEYKGMKFARKLLLAAENAMATIGISEIHLLASQETIDFYSNMGYEPSGVGVKKSGLLGYPMTKRGLRPLVKTLS